MECANEVGVTSSREYNGDLILARLVSVGGQMVKKMIRPMRIR
jgi:hypothetical protein